MKLLIKDSDFFFEKTKPKFTSDLIQIIVFAALFSALSAMSIEFGWTTLKSFNFFEGLFGIFFITVFGFLLLGLVTSILASKKVSRKPFIHSLFILAYAGTPAMVISWIPHGFAKLIGIVWSLIFIKVGLEVSMKKTQKQSTIIVIVLAIILILVTVFTQVYIISPIS